jgi:hypothetical protein
MKTRSISAWVAALATLPALTACDDAADGEGTLALEIWGEEFIEQGIPAGEFADGWAVTFDRFLVNVGQIGVAEEGAAPALEEPGYRVFDLVAAEGPVPISSVTAPAGTYGHTAYTVAPAAPDGAAGNATEADLQLLVDGGWSVYVEGSATDGTDSVTFAWGFGNTTVYDPCHSVGELEDGGAVAVQITIHGDHLFYDDAVSGTPDLRFADIALADADDDGEVTPAELAAYDITALPNYGVGSFDIDNLWDYIEHMTTTLGHIDGEGHCGE